jgi:hypothetical protein
LISLRILMPDFCSNSNYYVRDSFFPNLTYNLLHSWPINGCSVTATNGIKPEIKRSVFIHYRLIPAIPDS